MQIRRLETADVNAYRTMMLKAYEMHPDAFTSSVAERAAKPQSWWESRLDPDPLASEVVFGALEGPNLIGVVGISFETREKAQHKASVFGMYVAPEARRTGAGRRLLNAAMAESRSHGHIRVVQLTVTQGNSSAEQLYQSAGFKQFGIEPLAVRVGSRFVSKVHMWCDLTETRE